MKVVRLGRPEDSPSHVPQHLELFCTVFSTEYMARDPWNAVTAPVVGPPQQGLSAEASRVL
jgi:hypothetical protein